jgi:hypothetical protein
MRAMRTAISGVLVAGLLVVGAPGSAEAGGDDAAVVSEWNQRAVSTLVGDPATSPVADFLYMGLVQAAVYDAVVGVTGGYQPYHFRGTAAMKSSAEAAAATAAHGVLSAYVPSAAADLDAALAASLAKIDASDAAIEHGATFGAHTARHHLELRADDGRDGMNVPFTATPDIGLWRPSPPANAAFLSPHLGAVRPLLVDSATQYAPPRPPALTSARYAADYDEVKAMGRADPGSSRTAEQTAVARFFSGNAVPQMNAGLRQQASMRHLDIAAAARMFAAADMAVADGLITVWAEKLRTTYWRPSTAIQQGDADGNPATVGEPGWTPLLANPPYPDYPSGYNVVVAATVRALHRLFGPDIDLTLTFTPAGGTTQSRTFAHESDLTNAVVDARIWLGIHFRFADTAGRDIGLAVADHAIGHYFGPTG